MVAVAAGVPSSAAIFARWRLGVLLLFQRAAVLWSLFCASCIYATAWRIASTRTALLVQAGLITKAALPEAKTNNCKTRRPSVRRTSAARQYFHGTQHKSVRRVT